MKKHLLNLAMLGFFALTGTLGFTACSDDAVAGGDPSAEPSLSKETKEVNVNFVMNVDYGQPATTRQSAETVQIPSTTTNTFRGMENATLLPYVVANATFLTEANATNVKAARKFDMSKLYTSSMVDNTGTMNATSSSRRVIELPVPLQSTLMLIYGKAIKGTSTTENMDAKEGKIVMDIQEDASNTDISLVQRMKSEDVSEYKMAERLTAFILNRILHARVNARTDQVYTFNASHQESGIVRTKGELKWDYGAGNHLEALVWKDLGDEYAAYKASPSTAPLNMTPLEESLAEAYYNITQVAPVTGTSSPYTPGEYRAGSADAVARTIYDLYMICTNVYNATPTQNAEADAMRLASRIGHQIFGFYGIDTTNKKANLRNIGDAATTTSTIRYFIQTQQATGSDPADPIEGVNDTDFSSSTGKFYGLTDDVLRSFPDCFGLPKGAAQLAWEIPSATTIPVNGSDEVVKDGGTPVNQFVYHYLNQPFVTEMSTPTPAFDPEYYMYPAELAYYVNSALLVNSTALTTQSEEAFDALFPNGTTNWDNSDFWTDKGWSVGPVESTTNTIAVQRNVNYGVAMLKTTVTSSAAQLDDNRTHFKPGEPANKINVSGLRLVGILIGGQDNHVDWQYLPKDAANAMHVIYDNAFGSYNATEGHYNGIAIPAEGTSAANYTIVFDNYDKTIASTTKQKSVKFALEFRNDGTQDFWGEDNLIRQGGTFYIKGVMTIPDSELTTPTIVWDSKYQVPPLNQTTGVSTKTPRVFIQDHVTEANITLGANALKHAVVSVPDLRSSQTSLGLSVDLTWSQGLVFSPTIGE